MNHKTRRNLTIVLVLTAASAVLAITFHAVRAQSPTSRSADFTRSVGPSQQGTVQNLVSPAW